MKATVLIQLPEALAISSTSAEKSVLGHERLETSGIHGRLLRGVVVHAGGVRPRNLSPLDPNAV